MNGGGDKSIVSMLTLLKLNVYFVIKRENPDF